MDTRNLVADLAQLKTNKNSCRRSMTERLCFHTMEWMRAPNAWGLTVYRRRNHGFA